MIESCLPPKKRDFLSCKKCILVDRGGIRNYTDKCMLSNSSILVKLRLGIKEQVIAEEPEKHCGNSPRGNRAITKNIHQ